MWHADDAPGCGTYLLRHRLALQVLTAMTPLAASTPPLVWWVELEFVTRVSLIMINQNSGVGNLFKLLDC